MVSGKPDAQFIHTLPSNVSPWSRGFTAMTKSREICFLTYKLGKKIAPPSNPPFAARAAPDAAWGAG